MPNRIELTESSLKDHTLILSGSAAELEGEIKATGQMLVDSDNFAFVYVLEYKQAFYYAILQEQVWPQINNALESDMPVYISIGSRTIELTGIHEELSYLLGNIKDNANYGEEMEKKVINAFL
ncbi:hypothetical protein ABES80_12545 [Bacillus gobiensis]|uniref:UPF0738 family protein n=1 Tax=Bacillus gobiensis TaxID=1441095 RepID=UPI003D1FD6F9